MLYLVSILISSLSSHPCFTLSPSSTPFTQFTPVLHLVPILSSFPQFTPVLYLVLIFNSFYSVQACALPCFNPQLLPSVTPVLYLDLILNPSLSSHLYFTFFPSSTTSIVHTCALPCSHPQLLYIFLHTECLENHNHSKDFCVLAYSFPELFHLLPGFSLAAILGNVLIYTFNPVF